MSSHVYVQWGSLKFQRKIFAWPAGFSLKVFLRYDKARGARSVFASDRRPRHLMVLSAGIEPASKV